LNENVVTVNNAVIQDDMKYNGETVLTYKIEYPQFSSMYYPIALNEMNQYYLFKAKEIQKYYTNELYKSAVEDYKYRLQNGFPFNAYEGLVQYNVTYNMFCVISIFTDNYIYSGGAHGNTVRNSETWNLQDNSQIKLNELFECLLDYKDYVLKKVKDEIIKNPSIYFSDDESFIVENFNAESFYCTPEGIVIYYQQYDIAPYSSGIREFLIPYTDCVVNPFKKCFPLISKLLDI